MYFCFKTDLIPKISYMNQNITCENWMQLQRTPDEYILIIVNSGCLYLKEDNNLFELHAGDLLLLQPGHTHVGYKESFCDYYYIHMNESTFTSFDCGEIENIEKIILDNKKLFYKCNPFNGELYEQSRVFIPKDMHIEDINLRYDIAQAMKEAIRAYECRDEHYKLICSCKFMEILTLLSSYFTRLIFKEAQNEKSEIRGSEKTQEVITLIHNEYPGKITGNFIETRLEMNFDYLNRLFKQQMGITIFSYLNDVRITKAKEFLINGNLKSYEIAGAVGFCDEYHFSKVFKKMVGMSPKLYLQNHLD